MKGNLSIMILFCLLACSSVKVSGQAAGKTMAFTLDLKVLEKNRSAIANNDPAISEAYKMLIKDAGKAMQFEPVSVMEKTNLPPSGDKHDYMSLAPYFWPILQRRTDFPTYAGMGKPIPK